MRRHERALRRTVGQPGDQGVRVFVIHGNYHFQDKVFLAYGMEYVGAQAALIGIPQHKRWQWSRRVRVQRGESAEQILWTLLPLIKGELVWLGSHDAEAVAATSFRASTRIRKENQL